MPSTLFGFKTFVSSEVAMFVTSVSAFGVLVDLLQDVLQILQRSLMAWSTASARCTQCTLTTHSAFSLTSSSGGHTVFSPYVNCCSITSHSHQLALPIINSMVDNGLLYCFINSLGMCMLDRLEAEEHGLGFSITDISDIYNFYLLDTVICCPIKYNRYGCCGCAGCCLQCME